MVETTGLHHLLNRWSSYVHQTNRSVNVHSSMLHYYRLSPGSVELVCDIWAQQEHSRPGGSSVREQCALLLRNCCFYGPAKSILATDGVFITLINDSHCFHYATIDQIVGIFSQCLQCEQLQLVSVAATAIWALLHNCTKVTLTIVCSFQYMLYS